MLYWVVGVQLRLDDGVDAVHEVHKLCPLSASPLTDQSVKATCVWYLCITPVGIVA